MKKILILLLLACPAIAFSQSFDFDLGGPITKITYTVPGNQPIAIHLINLLPNGNGAYTINQSSQIVLSKPLSLDTAHAMVSEKTDNNCLSTYETQLNNAKTESDFAKIMADAKTNCIAAYNNYLAASSYNYYVNPVKNETVTLTVTNTKSNAIWTIILQPEDRGQFVTVYGFTFIPYLFSKPHTYYALPIAGNVGSYKITKGSNEGIADYAPTVSFHFITNNTGAVSQSFTAGLGAASNSSDNSGITPVVLLGYSVLVNQNIGFNIGIASDLINNLKGQYQNGQTISTNLESNDLTEKQLGFNPFFSVIFRFGSSPFSVKSVNTNPSSSSPPAPASNK